MAGVQLGLAGLVVLAGAAGGQALAAVAGWWTVYGGLVDLGALVVGRWAGEHALSPLPLTHSGGGGGVDGGVAADRVGSVLALLAAWTGAHSALGRRLLPVMAARRLVTTATAPTPALGHAP